MSDDSEKLLPVLPVDPPVRGTCGPDDRASASVDQVKTRHSLIDTGLVTRGDGRRTD